MDGSTSSWSGQEALGKPFRGGDQKRGTMTLVGGRPSRKERLWNMPWTNTGAGIKGKRAYKVQTSRKRAPKPRMCGRQTTTIDQNRHAVLREQSHNRGAPTKRKGDERKCAHPTCLR